MKYLVFAGFCMLSLPVLVYAGTVSTRLRGWLLALIIFSTCLGTRSSIHITNELGEANLPYRGTEDGLIIYFTHVFVVALCCALVLRHWRRLVWAPYNTAWLATLFGIGILSGTRAMSGQLTAECLYMWAMAYLAYWAFYNALRLGTPSRYMWYGLVGTGGFISLLAAKQAILSHAMRATAMFPHSNTLPSYAFNFMFVLLLWGLCGRSQLRPAERVASVAVCLLLAFAVVQTMSRAGMVIMMLALLATLVLAMRRAHSSRVRLWCGALVAAMFLGGLMLSGEIIHRFRSAPEASAQARIEFNNAALSMAGDHVLGVGPNNFSLDLSEQHEYRRHLVVLQYEEEAGVCHNIYLLTAAETGWIGLIVFLIIVGRFWWNAARHAISSRSLEGLLLFGIAIGWTALLANASLEWVMRQPFVMNMYAIMAAYSVVLAESLQRQQDDQNRLRRSGSFEQPAQHASYPVYAPKVEVTI